MVAGCFPALAGYTQTRTLAEQVDPSAVSPFTGVAELWFADEAAALAAEAEPAQLKPLLAKDARVAAVASGMMRTVMRKPDYYAGGSM